MAPGAGVSHLTGAPIAGITDTVPHMAIMGGAQFGARAAGLEQPAMCIDSTVLRASSAEHPVAITPGPVMHGAARLVVPITLLPDGCPPDSEAPFRTSILGIRHTGHGARPIIRRLESGRQVVGRHLTTRRPGRVPLWDGEL